MRHLLAALTVLLIASTGVDAQYLPRPGTPGVTFPAITGVDVTSRATGGTGTQADPWVGWDTAITWASNTTYNFRDGHYGLSAPLTITDKVNMTWQGDGINRSFIDWHNTTTTAGTYMLSVVSSSGNWAGGNNVIGLTFDGNYRPVSTNFTCPNGILWSAQLRSYWQDVNVQNISATAVRLEANVTCNFANLRISYHDKDSGTAAANVASYYAFPTLGLIIGAPTGRSADISSNCIFNGLMVEDVSGVGVELQGLINSTFNAYTAEINNGIGMKIDSGSEHNVFNGIDIEQNNSGGVNTQIDGNRNEFIGGGVGGVTTINGLSNTFVGVKISSITLSSSSSNTIIDNSPISGAFTDSTNNGAFFESRLPSAPAASATVDFPFANRRQIIHTSRVLSDPGGVNPTITSDIALSSTFHFVFTSTGSARAITMAEPAPLNLGATGPKQWRLFRGMGNDFSYSFVAGGDAQTYTVNFDSGWSLGSLNGTTVTIPTITQRQTLQVRAVWNEYTGKLCIVEARVIN